LASVWWDPGPGFVRRVLITTAWLGGVCCLCIGAYVGFGPAIAWVAGVGFGLADLALINGLIREATGRQRRPVLLALFGLKTVALYASGAVVLFVLGLDPLFLLAGFSLFLVVVVLKIAGRMLLSSRWMEADRRGPGGSLLRDGPGRRGGRP
jgi:hypothetical protein